MVDCHYNTFEIKTIFKDNDEKVKVINYGIDKTNKKILILIRKKNSRMQSEKFMNIFCLLSERIIASVKTGNEELIGRMKTNFYQFVSGHIYFNNQVFKVRYDLI